MRDGQSEKCRNPSSSERAGLLAFKIPPTGGIAASTLLILEGAFLDQSAKNREGARGWKVENRKSLSSNQAGLLISKWPTMVIWITAKATD